MLFFNNKTTFVLDIYFLRKSADQHPVRLPRPLVIESRGEVLWRTPETIFCGAFMKAILISELAMQTPAG